VTGTAGVPHALLDADAAALLELDRPVDVLVGIPSFQNARTIGHVVRAVEAGLRKYFPDRRCLIAVSDGASTDGTVAAAMAATTTGDEELLLLDPKVEPPDRLAMTYIGLSGKGSGPGRARSWTPTCARSARPGSTGWSGRSSSTATTWSPRCTPATSWTAPSPTRSPSR
jgi:hypothetical protein